MKKKLMLFTISSVVACSTLLILIVSKLSEKALYDQISSNLQAISASQATDVSQSFTQFAKEMKDLTNSKFIQDALVSYESVAFGTGISLDEDADISKSAYFKTIDSKYSENFTDYLKSYPLISFGIVLNNGFTVSQVGGSHLLGKNLLTGSFKNESVNTCLKNAISGTEFYTEMIVENGISKSYYCQKIISKYDRDGYLKNAQMGVLVAELDWNIFAKLKDFHEGLGKTGELFLIDGNKVFTPPRKLSVSSATEIMQKKIIFDLKFDENKKVQDYKNFDGDDSLVVIRKLNMLPSMDWFLVAQISKDESLEPIYNLNRWSYSVLAIALCFVTLLSWSFVSSIAKGFIVAGKGISDNAQKVNGASIRFGQISGVVAAGTLEQSAALEETASCMEEVNSMVHRTLELSKRSSVKASECVKNANEGIQKMNKLVDSITSVGLVTSEAFDKVKDGNNKLTEIIIYFKEVQTKTKIINDIAFQTKLLSFNASVEAARAGEHGKGFAVVAAEIGLLAKVVDTSASEINSLIDTTAEKINTLVGESRAVIDESILKSDIEINSSQKEAKEGLAFFKDLASIIEDINSEVVQVSTASEEQSNGIGEINTAVLQISESNGKNVVMSTELEQQTKVLEDAVYGLASSETDMKNILFGKNESLIKDGIKDNYAHLSLTDDSMENEESFT